MRKRNVFDDLFSPEKASIYTIKSNLHSDIIRCAKNYDQRELMTILDVSQPRVSDLLRGKISNFSLDTLVVFVDRLRMRPEIKTRQPLSTMSVSV